MTVKEDPRYRRMKEKILKMPGAKEAYERGREIVRLGMLSKAHSHTSKSKK